MTEAYHFIISHTNPDSKIVLDRIAELLLTLKTENLIKGYDIEPDDKLTQYVREEYGEE